MVAIELEHDARLHFSQARLHDPRLREGADYYLSVRSLMPVAQLQEQFPQLCKVGSPDHVRSIVNSSRVGVPPTPPRHVPAAIPLRLETSISALMSLILWPSKCSRAAPVCFTFRECLASLNLNSLRYCEHE